ncbi:MAG: hypothetical protein ACYDAG_00455 [Chloroflexota bacterium]
MRTRNTIRNLIGAALLALSCAGGLGPSAAVAAGSSCQYVLGFKTLATEVPAVGACADNQAYAANGDALQHTANGGLLVWRKADNWTAFTDGAHTWINGPQGLVERLNSQRFSWEADAGLSGTTTIRTSVPARVCPPVAGRSINGMLMPPVDGSKVDRSQETQYPINQITTAPPSILADGVVVGQGYRMTLPCGWGMQGIGMAVRAYHNDFFTAQGWDRGLSGSSPGGVEVTVHVFPGTYTPHAPVLQVIMVASTKAPWPASLPSVSPLGEPMWVSGPKLVTLSSTTHVGVDVVVQGAHGWAHLLLDFDPANQAGQHDLNAILSSLYVD